MCSLNLKLVHALIQLCHGRQRLQQSSCKHGLEGCCRGALYNNSMLQPHNCRLRGVERSGGLHTGLS